VTYLFSFRKFIARLPDKGKKISDFVEKLTLAISQEEELAKTAELLSAVRLEFQAKREEVHKSKQQATRNDDVPSQEDSSAFNENSNIKEVSKIASQRQEAECTQQDATNTASENRRTQRKNDKIKTAIKDQNHFCEISSKSATSSHLKNDQQISRINSQGGTESTGALDKNKDMLVD
ncbi:GRL1A polymerase, partial [Casuarius casuarius]|nr:GRL1A polymerase [Casuarius casuarius]